MTRVIALHAILLASAPARAQDPTAQARELFGRGVELLADQRFAEAADALERSLAVRDSPPVLYNLGLAYRGMGRYLHALQVLERFRATAGDRHQDVVATLADVVADLRTALVHASVEARGGATEVRVDDEVRARSDGRIEVEMDPGRHVFVATRSGYAPARRELDLGRGERVTVELDASASPLPAALVVDAGNPDAEIRLDGEDVARGRLERELPPGTYTVEVSAPGFLAQTRSVELGPGARERLSVSLEKESGILSRWWFWAGAAAVVSGGVVAAVLWTEPETPPYDEGSLGFVTIVP
jgi:hypothetical protein